MSNIVTTFIAYRTKRNELKKKYREQMEADLAPYLADFGAAVIQEQSSGKSIEEVEHLIGVRNRNLIYAAKRAWRFRGGEGISTPQEAEKAPEKPAESRVQVSPAGGDGYNVFIDNKWAGTVWVDPYGSGEMTIPEEWALDTENAPLYREAVRLIRESPGFTELKE